MKKLLNYILPFAVVLIAGTGCLKDKGFDNNEYGINDPDTQPVGIGFPQGQGKNEANARGINLVNTAQAIPDPVISLFGTDPAPTDLHVNIVANNALITAYNTAHGTNYIPLPASSYNLSGLKVTIPKGQRFGTVSINIPNATVLDPLKSYAVGFTITSVDEAGYQVAENLKDILLTISIKNKYDGIYTYKATYDVPADRPAEWLRTFTYPSDVELQTAGPLSVTFYNPVFGSGFIPLMAPGLSGFGATALTIVFDANDKVVSVNNPSPDSRNRQFTLIPGGNSRYEVASKTLFLEMTMSQNGFLPMPMHIQFIFKKPRP